MPEPSRIQAPGAPDICDHGLPNPRPHQQEKTLLLFRIGEGRRERGKKKKISSFQPQREKREKTSELERASERQQERCSPAVTPGEWSESEQPY